MSTIQITMETVSAILPHPNADRLEIALILGTQTLVLKHQFQVGEKVIFFPPDILLPPDISKTLGIQQYLKHAIWDGQKCLCRVAACRLRGVPSYGFITKVPWDLPLNKLNDFTDHYQAVKYEPPLDLIMQGDALAEPCNFPRYTDIEHYYRHVHTLPQGMPVRVTEKTHGTNCRLGSIKIDGLIEFVCGSHRTVKKDYNAALKRSLYWEPLLSDPKIQTALQELSKNEDDVVIYGEIFGPRIQNMDYGIRQGQIGFRVFDISINGRYLDWSKLHLICVRFGLQLVPVIYVGPFNAALVQEWTNGPTLYGDVKTKFKGREGCVITPLTETYHPDIGRVILKSVSADYLNRKGATDNA